MSRKRRTSGWKKIPTTVTVTSSTRPCRFETDDECSEEDCDYECCECLGSFQQDIADKNGAEWVRCGCGQWIHEDCIDQVVTGKGGKHKMCSNCVL